MFALVVSDGLEDVVQGLDGRPSRRAGPRRLKLVEEVQIFGFVVRLGDPRRGQLAEKFLILIRELAVRVHRMRLDELREVIRQRGGDEPEREQDDVIHQRRVLRQKPIPPSPVASEGFHDEQVVVLVPLLREVHPAELAATPPPPEELVHRQHRVVAEVGHPRHRLEEPKSLHGRIFREDEVEEVAQREVGRLDDPRRGNFRSGALAFPYCVVGQAELAEHVAEFGHEFDLGVRGLAARDDEDLLSAVAEGGVVAAERRAEGVELAAKVLGGDGDDVFRDARGAGLGHVDVQAGVALDVPVLAPDVREGGGVEEAVRLVLGGAGG